MRLYSYCRKRTFFSPVNGQFRKWQFEKVTYHPSHIRTSFIWEDAKTPESCRLYYRLNHRRVSNSRTIECAQSRGNSTSTIEIYTFIGSLSSQAHAQAVIPTIASVKPADVGDDRTTEVKYTFDEKLSNHWVLGSDKTLNPLRGCMEGRQRKAHTFQMSWTQHILHEHHEGSIAHLWYPRFCLEKVNAILSGDFEDSCPSVSLTWSSTRKLTCTRRFELAKECHDGPSRLGIETRRRSSRKRSLGYRYVISQEDNEPRWIHTLVTNSTATVVRFLCSTSGVPTTAST